MKTHVKKYSQGCYDIIKKITALKNLSQLYVVVKCLSIIVIFSFMIFFLLVSCHISKRKITFYFLGVDFHYSVFAVVL